MSEILKNIFFIVPIILGSFLLILIFVLFLPIKYHITGFQKEKNFFCSGKLYWIGPVFNMDFFYDKQLKVKIKFFGRSVNRFCCKKKARENSSDMSLEERTEKNEENQESSRRNDTKPSSPIALKSLNSLSSKKKNIKSWKMKILILKLKVQKILKDTEDRKQKFTYYYSLWKKEETQITFKRAKRRFLKILRSISPLKWEISGEFGFRDPSITGELMGVLGMIYPYTRKNIRLIPNFEEEIIDCQGYCKGKIRIITVLYQTLALILNKYCFQFIKLIFSELNNSK